jgi:hypothetical protein
MATRSGSICIALLAGSMLAGAIPSQAAEVTPDRLLNPDKEPQNNHRSYDGQRFSPLARINKGNVKGLRLAYAVPLGGLGSNEWNEATPRWVQERAAKRDIPIIEAPTGRRDEFVDPYFQRAMYGRRPRCKRNLTISEAFGCGHVFGL